MKTVGRLRDPRSGEDGETGVRSVVCTITRIQSCVCIIIVSVNCGVHT